MRKYIKIAILGAVIIAGSSSCKKFLDVNQNPNNPTNSTPNIVLPQAILQTANSIVSYDTFGAWTAGYKANAGGYGGFGSQLTYQFTTADYTTMWTTAYAAINQTNFVINNTDATGPLKYYNAMARVLRSYLYQRLVDQYGDVPYSDAGKGINKLNPAYDKYSDVYKAIYAELDAAIAIMNTAPVTNVTTTVTAGQDPLFGGSVLNTAGISPGLVKWKQLANTIKLKMLIRTQKVAELSSWVTTAKATLPLTLDGYLTEDAILNPGFSASTSSQFNNRWSNYAWNINGVSAGSGLAQMPTPWIVSFYDGKKLSDVARGRAIYAEFGIATYQDINLVRYPFTGPATNQLGKDVDPVLRSLDGSVWYSGATSSTATPVARPNPISGTTANAAAGVVGVLKSAAMGNPLILASESYFLLSEAALINLVPFTDVSVDAAFNSGVTESFRYLYKNSAGTYVNSIAPATLFDNYKAANPTSPLVNISLAAGIPAKLEAIITQKYIAVNFIHSEEGFNEFRRTGYPKIELGSTDPIKSFASLKSTSSLPERVLYPAVEFQVNSNNVPKGVTSKTKIFYAK